MTFGFFKQFKQYTIFLSPVVDTAFYFPTRLSLIEKQYNIMGELSLGLINAMYIHLNKIEKSLQCKRKNFYNVKKFFLILYK